MNRESERASRRRTQSDAPNACTDGDDCTTDSCAIDFGCSHETISGCSRPLNPCNATGERGSSDQAVTDCVCGLDPYCCDTAWDSYCVSAAEGSWAANSFILLPPHEAQSRPLHENGTMRDFSHRSHR